MANIIVANATRERCQKLVTVLESAGYEVTRCCTSQAEVKRWVNQLGDCLIVTAVRLPDGMADDLAWDLGQHALIMVIGKPEQLALCDHQDLFRLAVPCSRDELTSAVNMLLQLQQMRIPRRSESEKEIIVRAKQYLMQTYAMTEPEAHHQLQKGAMDKGMRLAEFSALLLK